MDLATEAELREEIVRLRRDLDHATDDLAHHRGLAELGRLAGSVAHEVRNPLAALLTSAEVLLARMADEPRAAKLLAIIVDQAVRIEGIIADLIAYARDLTEDPVPTSVGDAIDAALQDLDTHLRQGGVCVDLKTSPGDTRVMSLQQHLSQVLHNLILNSIQAMTEGGVVTVAVTRRMGPVEGDLVRIAVSDAGPGVPEDMMGEIFEPFRTTKTRGVGLGLAVCRRLVRHAAGRITAANNPDGGLTVTLELQAADDA